jgi:hypothetical protein
VNNIEFQRIMAKNRKRKKTQAPRPKTQLSLKYSKTYLEECYVVARRIFRAAGEDPALLDVFSKRRRQSLFRVTLQPPHIIPMPGHSVPRHYLRYIQEDLIQFLRREYFHREAGVTWMDLVTVGETMIMTMNLDSYMDILSPEERAAAERLNRAFKERDLLVTTQQQVALHVKTTLMMLSQPNFRIYGQDSQIRMSADKAGLVQTLRITAHECQSLRFRYHNRERKAFRLAVGQFLNTEYTGATIQLSKIYPGIAEDRTLNIYIQSHALHRFKERVDTFHPMLRNQLFLISLMFEQNMVKGFNGLQLIACIAPENGQSRTIAYFTFTIDGDNLLVLTVLPLLSSDTPEGRILYNRLHLSVDDIKYLGMDRLSFFYEVDILQIPALRKVLFDELHLEYVQLVYNYYRTKDEPFDEKKTLFVKTFFQKLEEQPASHADVLSELAAAETVEVASDDTTMLPYQDL